MSPIQQMLLGVGAVATKTYVDDVFSTYLWTGNATARSFNNGIDNTKGGLVWMKSRSNGLDNYLFDTERGVEKYLWSNTTAAEVTASSGDTLTAFNNNGFSIGNTTVVNNNNSTFAGWNFRKAPGFFTCLTYVGNGSNRTISHDLGCVPGMIILKNLDASDHWVVYHRGNADSNNAAHYSLRLNTTAAKADWFNYFQDTLPTATEFTLGTDSDSNGNGENFIAYLFAGGESTAATARSVDFDGSGDYLSAGSSSDFTMGTGDFTVEGWVKFDNATADDGVFQISDTSGGLKSSGNAEGTTIALSHNPGGNAWNIFGGGTAVSSSSTFKRTAGQWYHFAYVRHSSTTTLYINGENIKSFSDSYNYDGTYLAIGGYYSTSYLLDGRISNFRIVKGTALYTSSFKPTNEPLSSVTNTKLLCCNNSSVTGTTTGTVTSSGDPTASSDSPFDDPAGFVFGDAGDQNVIKCGSYVGSGSAGLEVNVGWEPSWVLIKNSSTAKEWKMLDSMRGLPTGSGDNVLIANSNEAETGSLDNVDLTSTGFKLTSNNSHYNTDGDTYIYMCIRRSDGYVGKPPELGSDCFAMDTQIANGYPMYISNFAVDYALHRDPTYSGTWEGDWFSVSRLQGPDTLITNGNGTEQSGSWQHWDYNNGFGENGSTSYTDWQAWMFKRHAGFDVLAWESGGSGETHFHGLGRAPEMIWIKNRSSTALWRGGHKGLNGGTNPWTYGFTLNNNSAEFQEVGTFWNGVVPSATSFSTGSAADAGGTSGDNYIAMLFASTDVSKVGSYTGTGGSGTISGLGFTPRFLILKKSSGAEGWYVFDTTRGWGSGNDQVLYLNSSNAQFAYDVGQPTSDGFTVDSAINDNNENYIYYAHA